MHLFFWAKTRHFFYSFLKQLKFKWITIKVKKERQKDGNKRVMDIPLSRCCIASTKFSLVRRAESLEFRPNPEDRINRIPYDQILHHTNE